MLRRPDGRQLAWEDAGDPDGTAIVFCHGTPGSRLQRAVFVDDATLHRCRVRMITPDRPGCGLSTFQNDRTIVAWPDDVRAITEHLGLSRFAVVGFSGGTPYAIAAAAAIPAVGGLGIVCGDAPPHRVSDFSPALPLTAIQRPHSTSATLRGIGLMARLAPSALARLGRRMLAPADRALVADQEMTHRFIAMLRDALRPHDREDTHGRC